MGALRKATGWLGLTETEEDWEYADEELEDDRTEARRDRRHARDEYRRSGYRDEVDDDWDDDEPEPPPRRRIRAVSDRAVPERAVPERVAADEAVNDYRIATVHPTTFHEARSVGEYFRDGVPVIMDLSGMEERDATRVVDFASGLIFGLRGDIDRIANRVFLLLPAGVRISHQYGGVARRRPESD